MSDVQTDGVGALAKRSGYGEARVSRARNCNVLHHWYLTALSSYPKAREEERRIQVETISRCGDPPDLWHIAQKIFGRRKTIQSSGCQDLGERILGAKTGNILSKDFYCCESESGFTSGTGSVGGKKLHSLHKHQKSSGHKLIFIGFKWCQFFVVNRTVMKTPAMRNRVF